MENPDFKVSLKEVIVELQRYVDLQLEYNKVLFAKKLGDLSSYFVLFLLILGISGFAMLFISLTFVDWFEVHVGNRYFGSLIVTGFYILIAIIIIVFRKPLIFNPLKKLMGSIVSGEDGDGNKINPLESEETLKLQIKKHKEAIKKEQKRLNEKFDELTDVFTIGNIIQSASKSLYKTYLTTSNIAKVAFTLIGRLKGGNKKKKSKRKHRSSSELKENND